MNQPIAFTIPDAAKASGLSRTAIYVALKKGQLTAVKSGRRTLIPFSVLSGYLAALPPYKGGA